MGVYASESDSGIFAGVVNCSLVLLAIYAHDLFIACETMKVMRSIKDKLSSTFEMKDLGIIKHFFGMDIIYLLEEGKVVLRQGHFLGETKIVFTIEVLYSILNNLKSWRVSFIL